MNKKNFKNNPAMAFIKTHDNTHDPNSVAAHVNTYDNTHDPNSVAAHVNTYDNTHDPNSVAAHINTHVNTHDVTQDTDNLIAHDNTHDISYLSTHDDVHLDTHHDVHLKRDGYIRTQGRKGHKKPRINLAFDSAVFLNKIRLHAEKEGKSITQFVNDAVAFYIDNKRGKK